MMVNINIPLPDSCASCPLSVRHFGKLYCPPLNDRVGNEGKDGRCPLHESVTIKDTDDKIKVTNCNDNISRQAICDALDIVFADRIKSAGFDSYETADRDTQLVCDGIMKAIDVVLEMPSAQPELIEQGAYVRGFEQGRTQGMIDSQGGKK